MDFQTPDHVCKYMVGLIPPGIKRVLEPTPGEGNLVKEIEAASYICDYPQGDFLGTYLKPGTKIECILANPPFSPATLGYKFLFNFMEISPIVICLMPWSALINSDSRTEKLLDFGLVSVTHLPRKTFPGARGNFCILHLQTGLDIHLTPRIYFY